MWKIFRIGPRIHEILNLVWNISDSILKKTLLVGSNQYQARRAYDLCVYFMTGALEGSTKSGSGEAIFMDESETFPKS